jgi:hypothetical protein
MLSWKMLKSGSYIKHLDINWDWIICGMHTRSREIEYSEKLKLNAPIFYHINGFSK